MLINGISFDKQDDRSRDGVENASLLTHGVYF